MLLTIASALVLVVAAPTTSPTTPAPKSKPALTTKTPAKAAKPAGPAAPVVVAPPPPPEPIDPGTVQSVDVVEVVADPACPEIIDRDRRYCGKGRRFELRRGERDRALTLINSDGPARACSEQATHAFLVQTTKGPRVVTVSFRCKTIGGRAFVGTAEQEAASFFRAQGLVTGL